ncbi:cytochrome P450 [Aspergillus varians]
MKELITDTELRKASTSCTATHVIAREQYKQSASRSVCAYQPEAELSQSGLYKTLTKMSSTVLLAIALIFLAWFFSKSPRATAHLQVPTVTFGWFVPDFVNRLLFFVLGRYLIYNGYKKYKDVPFRVRKVDADIIVLPARYLPHIRQLPHTRLSLLEAQFDSVCGDYTNVLNDSHLPSITVTKKLTPAMGRLIPRVIDELQHAFQIEVPECNNDWVSVNIYYTILKLINRSTSRIIVGERLCRSEQWLNTVAQYTEHLGMTILLLRPLPRFIRPLAAKLLPSVRYLNKTLKWVKEDVFVPMILERREAEANDPEYQKPDDFMQWMMEIADNDFDKDPGNIAHGLMIIMALAISHTSTMLITQGIYDLMVQPEYLEPLRTEIIDTLKNGWVNATKADFAAQIRLDSFLRESQRLNPSSEVNIHRIAKETIIFPDGLMIPKGTYICFPSGPLSRDPDLIESPETFNGFRWCQDPNSRSNSLVSINDLNLHFGYGRQACPGRHFAANTAKAILSRLLVEYDMKFEKGKEGKRPRNIRNGEQILPNLYTKLLLKKRNVTI